MLFSTYEFFFILGMYKKDDERIYFLSTISEQVYMMKNINIGTVVKIFMNYYLFSPSDGF
jgi:hypothetical protein